MATLSLQAQRKRLEDMLKIAAEMDPFSYYVLLLIGVRLLARYILHKLTPAQRFALTTTLILTGGIAIGILVRFNQVWLAIVLVFVLGITVGLIARM